MLKNRSIGMHFGHDAAIATIHDDGIEYTAMERTTRCKHALGIESEHVWGHLETPADRSSVVLSCTQGVPVFFDRNVIDIELENAVPYSAADFFGKMGNDSHYHKYSSWSDEKIYGYEGLLVPEDTYRVNAQDFSGQLESFSALAASTPTFQNRSGLCFKRGRITSAKDQNTKPFQFWEHHYLHAVYAACAASGLEDSLILTFDGWVGPVFGAGGAYFFSKEAGVKPILPVDGWIGQFYDNVADMLGLGIDGGAGKLMGLAPYGKPIYFSDDLTGMRHEVMAAHGLLGGNAQSTRPIVNKWLSDITNGEDVSTWDKNCKTPPKLVADIAASAQSVLEVHQTRLCEAALRMCANGEFEPKRIIFSGGVSLNCPANSRIFEKYNVLKVPPAVNDEGLAIGGAVLGWKALTDEWPDGLDSPYLGHEIREEEMQNQADSFGWRRIFETPTAACVQLLKAGGLIAVARGKSEVGPRALGHRSLIADANSPTSWERVNEAKGREMWRPLAPAVLHRTRDEYFDSGPKESKYMLFTYRVKSSDLPAITHCDQSARVQTVGEDCPSFFLILEELERNGFDTVILNTSLNGPGRPIAETEEDVFKEAAYLKLDAVYTIDSLFINPGSKIDPSY